eukprot:CAMPEP_0202362380 /NCGR_PEP_ID=MMETSP1126-20121109/14578_1 /ASSEMBLY_ACC=CAM_ASM_000457 /TAXON_ID=3047 /ORGANISM="Dunaliella tertiolecta, Strain CCMP1320" /LENGTH=58 /DNA_ID=CAMNT_0048956545 /DNA_START=402 /DNA_END=578 /DNA_ORIENTATION=+
MPSKVKAASLRVVAQHDTVGLEEEGRAVRATLADGETFMFNIAKTELGEDSRAGTDQM